MKAFVGVVGDGLLFMTFIAFSLIFADKTVGSNLIKIKHLRAPGRDDSGCRIITSIREVGKLSEREDAICMLTDK